MTRWTSLSLLCLLSRVSRPHCECTGVKENATHCGDELVTPSRFILYSPKYISTASFQMAYTHTTRLDLLYPLLYRTGLEQKSNDPASSPT